MSVSTKSLQHIIDAHRALNRGKAECSNQVHTHEELPKAA